MITYIASFAYEKKYYPLTLSKFQYSTYKSHQDIPDDVDSITYASNLGQCPSGQCAINKSTGFKRCPQNVTNKIVYNQQEEACTRINYCDYESLPYAVFTDGSASGNICENNPDGEKIPCRCTNNKKCTQSELVKFSITGGDPSNVSSNNFSIIQSDFIKQDKIGYSNLSINDSSTEFCKINPGFTDTISNGCNFNNSIQDRLGCEFISEVVIDNSSNQISPWELYKDVSIGDTVIYLKVRDDVNEDETVLPSSGILILTESTGNSSVRGKTETVKYKDVIPLPNELTGFKVVALGSLNGSRGYITNISLFEDGKPGNSSIPGLNGFATNWSSTSDQTSVSLADATVNNCMTPNSEPNYKNMLLCTQRDNNLCKYGNFSYNFDKLRNIKDNEINVTNETFSRNFCQLNIDSDPNIINTNYLQDPSFYTLSCSIGSGCNGKNFRIPTDGSNVTDSINSQATGKYFPEVDINGINGTWGVSTKTFPLLDLEKSGQLLNNQTIQPGDFWSIKFFNQTLLSGDKITPKDNNSITVQNLFGLSQYVNSDIPDDPALQPGLSIGTSSYRLTKATYSISETTNKNVSGISIQPGLCANLDAYSPIFVRPPTRLEDYTYGIISRDSNITNGKYVLKTIDGLSIPNNVFQDTEVSLTIYKQFSFSGPNYVTKLVNTGSFNRRLYINGSNKPYQTDLNSINDAKYLLPPQNIYELDMILNTVFDNNAAFYSPQAPFKIPMSMYYPVWNPVLFQQECVRCKPLLMSSPKITSEGKISSIIIQFCGKDFSNYQYNADKNTFCYVSTSNLDFNNPEKSEITSQRLTLKDPNFNVMVGDYVLDCGLQLPHKVIGDPVDIYSQTKNEKYSSLQILPQIYPSKGSITENSATFNQIYDGEFPLSFGLEECTSENFSFQSTFHYPNKGVSVTYNTKSNSWSTETNDAQNYFFGKKYQDPNIYNTTLKNGSTYTDGFYFVPIQRVTEISEDKRVFILDSPYPYKLQEQTDHTTHVQFCRLDSSLGLCVTSSGGQNYPNTILSVDSISDSRITNIRIDKNDDIFLQENPPLISVDIKNQNFI